MQPIISKCDVSFSHNQFLHSRSVHNRLIDMLGRTDAIIITYVLSKNFVFFAPFSDMLHSRYAIGVHLHQMTVKFDWGNIFHPSKPKETLRENKFSKSLLLRNKLPLSCT
jgi:hypothetical protein